MATQPIAIRDGYQSRRAAETTCAHTAIRSWQRVFALLPKSNSRASSIAGALNLSRSDVLVAAKEVVWVILLLDLP